MKIYLTNKSICSLFTMMLIQMAFLVPGKQNLARLV